jgi:hypothetical protein
MNPDDQTQLAYRVSTLPLTYVIAPDGTIRERIAGLLTETKLTAIIDQ